MFVNSVNNNNALPKYIIKSILDECNTFLANRSDPTAYSRCIMSVMLCLQMYGIYKCWGVLMVGFLWRELIVKDHSKL